MNGKSFAQTAGTLKELGIEGLTDELVAGTEAGYANMPADVEFDRTVALLTAVGTGDYDYDTWDWTPTNHSVYSFDVEVFNVSQMYTFFLRGVSAIGDGELEFGNISENTDNVDWKAGTGKRSVTFDWNGKTYTLEGENQDDWFDFEVANQLNKVIMEQGGSKKLYFASDGYQECIVFYCDDDWAKLFYEKTGLKLEM